MSIRFIGEQEGSFQKTSNGTRVSVTKIFFADAGENSSALRNHADFPAVGSPYPGDSSLTCSEFRIVPGRSGRKIRYAVECVYTEPDSSASISSGDGVQYEKAFSVSVSPLENVVPFDFSYDRTDGKGNPRNPVVNAAGEPISATTLQITMLLRFSYYLRTFSPSWLMDCVNTVNQSSLLVCGIPISEGCGLMRSLNASLVTLSGGNGSCAKNTVEIEISRTGFERSLPNRGYYCRIDSRPGRVFYGERSGYPVYGSYKNLSNCQNVYPVDRPVWLDSSGAVDTAQFSAAYVPVPLKFKDKRSASWSHLSLPRQAEW